MCMNSFHIRHKYEYFYYFLKCAIEILCVCWLLIFQWNWWIQCILLVENNLIQIVCDHVLRKRAGTSRQKKSSDGFGHRIWILYPCTALVCVYMQILAESRSRRNLFGNFCNFRENYEICKSDNVKIQSKFVLWPSKLLKIVRTKMKQFIGKTKTRKFIKTVKMRTNKLETENMFIRLMIIM